ncbi:MAG: acetylornithine deacetylase, partial [Muribaculaceae bacterium]|nr:acetylornithine deacetylase [Muribaculaceae bacterium]
MTPAVELLKQLISTPSPSRREEATASLLFDYLQKAGAEPRREANNVWAVAPGYDSSRPTLLLNSHHDTVD